MTTARLIACTCALVAMFAIGVEAATYEYVAQTSAPVRMSGAVTAAGVNWSCAGHLCRTTGPWPNPEVAACQALARQVGAIAFYGHKDKMLQPAELQRCNAAAGSAKQALPGARTTQNVPPSARTGFTPKTVNTGPLELTGQRFTPKTINTGPLELTGQRSGR